MAITVTAVYEGGVLKLAGPLPFAEHQRVEVTVCAAESPLLKAYGIIGWTGSAEDLERLALDPEFLPEEAP
jgi:predicted DNA-binding antitoxin AbrB/MazE fold protein